MDEAKEERKYGHLRDIPGLNIRTTKKTKLSGEYFRQFVILRVGTMDPDCEKFVRLMLKSEGSAALSAFIAFQLMLKQDQEVIQWTDKDDGFQVLKPQLCKKEKSC